MAVDSTAMAAASAAVDTATAASAALDTEPTAGAPDVAEGPQPGDDAAAEPTPDQSSDEDGSAEDQGDTDAAESEQPREGEQKLTRSQRQALRQQEAIDKAVADALAKHRADQEAAAEAQRKAEKSTEAQRAKAARLAEFLGEPDEPGKPGTIARLAAEIDDLTRQIDAELASPNGADLDALLADKKTRQTELATYRRANDLAGEIEDAVFDAFRDDFTSAKDFPEFGGDPAKQAKYLNAPGGVIGGLRVLAQTIRDAKDAEWSAKLEAVEKKAADELAAQKTETQSWRVRAGGAELPNTAGGAAANSGAMTRTEFMALPKERKDQIRRDNPAAVAEIYSRSA